jgi:hypothetical protein
LKVVKIAKYTRLTKPQRTGHNLQSSRPSKSPSNPLLYDELEYSTKSSILLCNEAKMLHEVCRCWISFSLTGNSRRGAPKSIFRLPQTCVCLPTTAW